MVLSTLERLDLSKLNGSWLGNHQLHVSYAYPNPKSKPSKANKKNVPSKFLPVNITDSRSIADVVKLGKSNPNCLTQNPITNSKHGSFEFNSSDSDTLWLNRSLVRWLHYPLNCLSIPDKLIDWGFLDCKSMGGNLALLTLTSDEVFSQIISGDLGWLSEWF